MVRTSIKCEPRTICCKPIIVVIKLYLLLGVWYSQGVIHTPGPSQAISSRTQCRSVYIKTEVVISGHCQRRRSRDIPQSIQNRIIQIYYRHVLHYGTFQVYIEVVGTCESVEIISFFSLDVVEVNDVSLLIKQDVLSSRCNFESMELLSQSVEASHVFFLR